MKNNPSTHFMLLITSIIIISSCSKDEPDNFNTSDNSYKDKLHKIITYVAGDSAFYEFKYDINGKITNIFAKSEDDDYLTSFAFSRNTSGHLIGCIHKETEKVIHNIVYNVDQAGKFISSQQTSSVSGKIVKASEKFTYTGDQLTKIEYTSEDQSQVFFINLKYDGKGNLIKVEDSRGRTQEATFDNKTNPVELLNLPYFMMNIDVLTSVNPNNIITKKYVSNSSNYSQSFSYSYNKSGKPASGTIILQRSNGTGDSYNLKYVYY